MFEKGYGVPRDFQMAAKWYQKAAEQGYSAAQCSLGLMYENGYGVPQNAQIAAEWYRKAAEQGYAFAQHNLGVMYFDGNGVPQDYQRAVDKINYRYYLETALCLWYSRK